ncbi:MAG: hypothetical protein MZV65_46145 [Chromatiales bacterium]|nr:hypothetical protein [Chromatiales bacterium]
MAEDDPARQHARREEMAENLRLFYVALTRAKLRCYLVWGKIKEAETAPPAWLLHRPTVKESGKDWLQATQERFRKMEGVAIRNELQTVFAAAGETVAIAPLPQESGQRYQSPTVVEPELKARIFGGSLARILANRQFHRPDRRARDRDARLRHGRRRSRPRNRTRRCGSRSRHLRFSAWGASRNLPARDFRTAGFHPARPGTAGRSGEPDSGGAWTGRGDLDSSGGGYGGAGAGNAVG